MPGPILAVTGVSRDVGAARPDVLATDPRVAEVRPRREQITRPAPPAALRGHAPPEDGS